MQQSKWITFECRVPWDTWVTRENCSERDTLNVSLHRYGELRWVDTSGGPVIHREDSWVNKRLEPIYFNCWVAEHQSLLLMDSWTVDVHDPFTHNMKDSFKDSLTHEALCLLRVCWHRGRRRRLSAAHFIGLLDLWGKFTETWSRLSY